LKAQEIAQHDFWRGVAAGLRRRGLPELSAQVTSGA